MTKQAGIRAGILKKTVIAVKPELLTITLDEPFVPIVVLIGICPVHSVDCPAALLRNIQSSHLEVPSAFGKLCLPSPLLSINIADWHTSKQKNTI